MRRKGGKRKEEGEPARITWLKKMVRRRNMRMEKFTITGEIWWAGVEGKCETKSTRVAFLCCKARLPSVITDCKTLPECRTSVKIHKYFFSLFFSSYSLPPCVTEFGRLPNSSRGFLLSEEEGHLWARFPPSPVLPESQETLNLSLSPSFLLLPLPKSGANYINETHTRDRDKCFQRFSQEGVK